MLQTLSSLLFNVSIGMDKTPKSKFFGFRSTAPAYDRPSSSTNQKVDVRDLETLPISPGVICTSPIPSVARINRVNDSSVDQISPQFVVGWKDSGSNGDIVMSSPIRARPALRKIRRCPDHLLFKAPKKITKDDGANAILQCLDWAKNLFESTSVDNEEKQNVESENETKDIDVDILDDSVDDIMILCSQAVEDSIPGSKYSSAVPINLNAREKHRLSPESNPGCHKRLKLDRASIPERNEISKNDERRESINPNNNEFEKKCNLNVQFSETPIHQSHVQIHASKVTLPVTSVNTPVASVTSQNSVNALLEDDDLDDLFGSFDFHTLEKNSTTLRGNVSKNPSTSFNSIATNYSNLGGNCKPVAKYTKEQIEQRRLEARKKLMFKRKNKSV